MRMLWKLGGVILSLSLIFTPEVAQAKSKRLATRKASKQFALEVVQARSKKVATHKVSKQNVKSLKHFGKHGKNSKKYAKSHFVRVSYSYGPRVYAEGIEPNSEIYRYAVGLLGTRYRFGGESINGIDCSYFVQNVFELAGYKMPRTAREQARYGYFVRKEDIKPGDLLFFATYAPFPSHVGIYIGDGKMIHASSKGHKVEVTSIYQDYYQKRFLFAKRIPANIKDLEAIKDVEEYMEDKNLLENIIIDSLYRKESLKPRKDSDLDPIARIIKEKNGN